MTLLEQYETSLRSWSTSERTITARVHFAKARSREWGDLTKVTSEMIRSFLASPAHRSSWTKATYHAHLRSLFGWLADQGHIDQDPMQEVRRTKPPRGNPHPLSDAEVDRIKENARGRILVWFQLALLAGLRAHEIAQLRGEDVTERSIWVEGKGDVRTMIPTHAEIWRIAQTMPTRGYWFPDRHGGHVSANTVSTQTGQLFRQLGIDGSIHRARHVYGTRLLRSGVHIRTVQKLMRHADLATTALYCAVDEDELRAGINKLVA